MEDILSKMKWWNKGRTLFNKVLKKRGHVYFLKYNLSKKVITPGFKIGFWDSPKAGMIVRKCSFLLMKDMCRKLHMDLKKLETNL